MIELLKKNVGEIIVIFLAVLAVYIIATKTNTPVNSIHFLIMSTVYAAAGIITLKLVKRSRKNESEGETK